MAEYKCDPASLKAGDILYEVSYHTVNKVDDEYVYVTTEGGTGQIRISRSIVRDSIFSTDQYAKEEKITRTMLAQKIEGLGHAAFRVSFKLQVASNDVADGLDNADMSTKTKRRKLIKELLDGKPRVMHARLFRTKDFDASMELGRYRVVDLDDLAKHGDEKRALRMVDTRTVTELVVDNIRYVV